MRKFEKPLLWLAVVLSVTVFLVNIIPGCAALDPSKATVPATWVAADRATFDAVSPVILLLTDSDPTNDPDLTGINSPALRQAIIIWQMRLQAAEAALPVTGGAQ